MKNEVATAITALIALAVVAAVLLVFVLSGWRIDADTRTTEQKAHDELVEMGFYGDVKTPSGKYASIADVYHDALAWTDRYEKGDVSAEELRKAFSDLRIETTAFDDASAVNLRVAMSDLSSATWKDRKSIYNAIDALRRLKIE